MSPEKLLAVQGQRKAYHSQNPQSIEKMTIIPLSKFLIRVDRNRYYVVTREDQVASRIIDKQQYKIIFQSVLKIQRDKRKAYKARKKKGKDQVEETKTFQRPPSIYSNTSPYGIAAELHQSKQTA